MTAAGGQGGTVHATAIVIGEDGILLRGPAGAGKSSFARELVASAESGGRYAALVSDDRVVLNVVGGRLVASAIPSIAGLLEIRGIGVVRVPHEPAAVLRLVVDLAHEPPRMAEAAAMTATVAGVNLPRITVNRTLGAGVAMWTLGHLRDAFVTVP